MYWNKGAAQMVLAVFGSLNKTNMKKSLNLIKSESFTVIYYK